MPRPSAAGPPRRLPNLAGAHGNVVRDAARQRDDILRFHGALSKRDREAVSDVPATANALYERVEALAVSLSELERNVSPNAGDAVESEIAALEAQANPLDLQASEERVRRLAYLKRQRRQIAGLVRRRDNTKEKMESCALALQNMGYDLMRLQSGRETLQHVTLVAERAMALAKEVDTRVYVADEMAKLELPSGSRRRSR